MFHIANNTVKRQSNLELLRIISMILVMLIHYLPKRMPVTIEMITDFPFKAFMNFELKSISFICVHCFILISGYFGIRWKWKSFFSLIFQIIFWYLIGALIADYLIVPYLNGGGYSFGEIMTGLIKEYQGRWFVSAYLCLYILSPLVNSFITNSTDTQIRNFILVFYLFSSVYGWFLLSREFNTGLSAISLLGLYVIGGWLRKSTIVCVTWSRWYDFGGFVLCTLILSIGSMALIKLGIGSSIHGYLNPIVVIESMFLFQFFRKTNFGSINWINFLASSAFAAFLLHCNPYIGKYYDMAFIWLHKYDYALLYVIIYLIIVFLIAVVVDQVRKLLWLIAYKLCRL